MQISAVLDLCDLFFPVVAYINIAGLCLACTESGQEWLGRMVHAAIQGQMPFFSKHVSIYIFDCLAQQFCIAAEAATQFQLYRTRTRSISSSYVVNIIY